MTGKNYTTAEAAKQVGVSKNTLLRWLYAKEIPEPAQKIGNNIRVWNEAEVAFVKLYKEQHYHKRA